MRILTVGKLGRGSSGESFTRAFIDLGHDVRTIDTNRWLRTTPISTDRVRLARSKAVSKRSNAELWGSISSVEANWRPDALVAYKTINFDQELLLSSRAARKVHISLDDVSNVENTSPHYLQSEADWSMIVTTKCHNLQELKERGVRSVLFMWSAYDPRYHLGNAATADRRHTIGFIGVARADRMWLPKMFGDISRGASIVRGPGWRRRYPFGVRGVDVGGTVPADRFLEVAASIFCGPVLLNSANRDTHTCRSFEVPASGMLVVAERTKEHSEMFEEGREALMFTGRDELGAVLSEVCRDSRRFEAIARAGQRKIIDGKNTYRHRAQQIIDAL